MIGKEVLEEMEYVEYLGSILYKLCMMESEMLEIRQQVVGGGWSRYDAGQKRVMFSICGLVLLWPDSEDDSNDDGNDGKEY